MRKSSLAFSWDSSAFCETEESTGRSGEVPRIEFAPNGRGARVLYLGKWQKVSDSKCWDPRPTLVEFANPRHRERFLVSADGIKTTGRDYHRLA